MSEEELMKIIHAQSEQIKHLTKIIEGLTAKKSKKNTRKHHVASSSDDSSSQDEAPAKDRRRKPRPLVGV